LGEFARHARKADGQNCLQVGAGEPYAEVKKSPPAFLVSVADKGLRAWVSRLESALAWEPVSVADKGLKLTGKTGFGRSALRGNGWPKKGLTNISTYVELIYGRTDTTLAADVGGSRSPRGACGTVASRVFVEPTNRDSVGDAVPDFDAAGEAALAGDALGRGEDAGEAAAALVPVDRRRAGMGARRVAGGARAKVLEAGGE